MSSSSLFLSVLIGVFVAIFIVGGWLFAEKRKNVARRFDHLEILAMAERLGIKLDLTDICKTTQGDRLLSAMVFCNECKSFDACHAFLGDETAPDKSITAFCPNAIFLLGLAATQEREAEKARAA